MTGYLYEAVDAAGLRTRGTLEVSNQGEALQRIKDMGLFPTQVQQRKAKRLVRAANRRSPLERLRNVSVPWLGPRIKSAAVTVFTRQLATLLNAGLPLLRGLRLLAQQQTNYGFKSLIIDLGAAIESGTSLSEALAEHPRVFNRLYVNMVRAGEASGALELTLRRLAEFQEKALRIRSRVRSAMFYPTAVMVVAGGILALMMVFVVPRFQQVFADLMGGKSLPTFTIWVLYLSNIARHHAVLALGCLAGVGLGLGVWVRTEWGRRLFDRFKLSVPVFGNVVRNVALARFARTLGTLLSSGVPILQALTIVRETVGNLRVARMVGQVHDSVKEGETVAVPLREAALFPPIIVGMVDVGEQTGALPDMLLRIADDADEQVDDAVKAMTSLLEPLMIVFLAVVVGCIVIAMFLPILTIIDTGIEPNSGSRAD